MFLDKVFSMANIIVNVGLSVFIFLVYILFLAMPAGQAFWSCLLVFGLLFVFDWVIALLKDRT